MVVHLTCKNEEDPIKNNGARVFTTLYINFSDAQGLGHITCMHLLNSRLVMSVVYILSFYKM